MPYHTIRLISKNWIHRISGPAAALILLPGLAACAGGPSAQEHTIVKQALAAGLAQQVVRSDGPANRSPVAGMPGDLSSKIYQGRYVDHMSASDDDKKDSAKE